EVQPRISARIDALCAEIDEGEAALAEAREGVETYRKALLKAAVTGELTADWRAANPPQESGEQLLQRILATRRANGHVIKKSQAGELVAEDDLPMLPDSWVWCRNEQAGMIQLGRQRTPKDHDGPHMRPYLRVANVYEERINLRDVKQMNFTPDEFETFELKSGDILLNEGQSLELVGRPAMFRGEMEGCCFQNTLVRFRAAPYVDGEYALLTFLYAMHTKRFQRIAKITTNIAHLGAGRFAEIGFPLAPLAEQREAVRLYHAHMRRFSEAISTLSETSALRRSILAAAFRGELAA
ncbi:MAG: restriction endonuclease subunit S, partial [bacterium]